MDLLHWLIVVGGAGIVVGWSAYDFWQKHQVHKARMRHIRALRDEQQEGSHASEFGLLRLRPPAYREEAEEETCDE